MSLSAFQNLIVELAQSIGATGMAANDDGYVGLTIDDRDVHVQYEPEDDVVVLFARLQEVEPERRAALYSMLLAANVFWQATFSWQTGVIVPIWISNRCRSGSKGSPTSWPYGGIASNRPTRAGR